MFPSVGKELWINFYFSFIYFIVKKEKKIYDNVFCFVCLLFSLCRKNECIVKRLKEKTYKKISFFFSKK